MTLQSAEAFERRTSTEPAVKPSNTVDPYFRQNLRYTSAFDNVGRLRFACFTVREESS